VTNVTNRRRVRAMSTPVARTGLIVSAASSVVSFAVGALALLLRA
jgi:hypothetical protein